jgi:ATP-dependent exoDNAse (exonuclease V) alpha subunit
MKRGSKRDACSERRSKRSALREMLVEKALRERLRDARKETLREGDSAKNAQEGHSNALSASLQERQSKWNQMLKRDIHLEGTLGEGH